MPLIAEYRCNQSNQKVVQGDFIAVLGNAPADGIGAPVGQADKILAEIGLIYCLACFQNRQTHPE